MYDLKNLKRFGTYSMQLSLLIVVKMQARSKLKI